MKELRESKLRPIPTTADSSFREVHQRKNSKIELSGILYTDVECIEVTDETLFELPEKELKVNFNWRLDFGLVGSLRIALLRACATLPLELKRTCTGRCSWLRISTLFTRIN